MKIVADSITLDELNKMAAGMFGGMVKAVVDIDRQLLAVDGELHADLEALLLEKGSKLNNLWGINIYPEAGEKECIEFDSMINMRPSQNNRSRSVEDAGIRNIITEITVKRIKR